MFTAARCLEVGAKGQRIDNIAVWIVPTSVVTAFSERLRRPGKFVSFEESFG
jgi:hypothetical protein